MPAHGVFPSAEEKPFGTSPRQAVIGRVLLGAGFALFALVVWRTAWVAEDAYINFRSIEQLFAGRGPRWNPHDRVQVFTSPLWYGLVAAGRLVSRDLFLVVIALSR